MCIFLLVFFLGNLSKELFTTAFYASLFVYLIYFIITFFIYRKDVRKDEIIEELSKENNELKEEFLIFRNNLIEYFMMWVHQIKTPITSAFLIAETMDDSREKKLLNTSLFSIDRYTDMVLSYLKLMEKDSNLDISDVDLDTLITGILKRYSFLFINNGIKLEYTPLDRTVISDSKWLSILVEQLISNAVKYTKKGSVSIFFDEDKNALVIKDTGIGIREEDIPRIFDRGFSGFNGRFNKQSSGIGLYIVRKISDKINVDVKVESEVGKGTVFYIIFR